MDKRVFQYIGAISMMMGLTLLSDDELKEFAKLAKDAKIEVIVTLGPRTIWDLGRPG